MAVQSNITLNTHVYSPRGVTSGVASWVNASNSSGAAVDVLTESVKGPNATGNTRVMFKLVIPKLAASDSVCACAGSLVGSAIATIDILVPGTFAPADRENLQLEVTALTASQSFIDAVKDLIGSW